jgi:3-methylcrotonyl-CoA carboxylase alpha subunit
VLGGPVEVRAIIPGRIVAISVAAGDSVEAGQQILVVEAMKMQNELRAPREGAVEHIGVAVGDTIEVGDLLVVIH